jgi:hypothetical protein
MAYYNTSSTLLDSGIERLLYESFSRMHSARAAQQRGVLANSFSILSSLSGCFLAFCCLSASSRRSRDSTRLADFPQSLEQQPSSYLQLQAVNAKHESDDLTAVHQPVGAANSSFIVISAQNCITSRPTHAAAAIFQPYAQSEPAFVSSRCHRQPLLSCSARRFAP